MHWEEHNHQNEWYLGTFPTITSTAKLQMAPIVGFKYIIVHLPAGQFFDLGLVERWG